MKKGIFGAAALLLLIGTAFAQTQSPPKTELEAFATSTGAVLLKGFTAVGSVSGAGQVTVNAMTFKNGSTGAARTGLLIEVREVGGGLANFDIANAYVDYDEIDALLKGLDTLSTID